MKVRRKHLVLQVITEDRQLSSHTAGGWALRKTGLAEAGVGRQVRDFLVENAAELWMSDSFAKDYENFPVPAGQRHVADNDTALSTGFGTYFNDSGARFTVRVGGRNHSDFVPPGRAPGDESTDPLPAGGIAGAVAHGLRAARLVSDDDLSDTSPVWQGLLARYDPVELMGHPDDLLGAGVVYRFPVFGAGDSIRWITTVVRGEIAGPMTHLRTRDDWRGTFGGQQLKEDSRQVNKRWGWNWLADVTANAKLTDQAFLWLSGGYRRNHEHSRGFGPGNVDRHIVRSTVGADGADGYQGEEFSGRLKLSIDIHADGDWLEPVGTVQSGFSRSGAEPVVRMRSQDENADGSGGHHGAEFRLVVPRQLTREGDTPATVPTQEESAAAAAAAEAAKDRVTPLRPEVDRPSGGALENILAGKMKALHFPDLGDLASQVGRDWYGPASNRGAQILAALGRRNVRDNSRAFLEGKLSLAAPSLGLISRPRITAKGTYRTVLRPSGRPFDLGGLHFRERTQQPLTYQEDTQSSNWHFGVSGGRALGTYPLTEISNNREQVSSMHAAGGDYTEFNRGIKGGQQSIQYNAKMTYTVSDGKRTSRYDSTHDAKQLVMIHDARELAEQNPDRMVHPDALAIPDDRDAQAFVTANDGYLRGLAAGEPLRLFGDAGTDAERDNLRQFAVDLQQELAARGLTPGIDLGIIRQQANGRELLVHERHDGTAWTAPPEANAYRRAAAPTREEAVRRAWSQTESGYFLSPSRSDASSALIVLDNPDTKAVSLSGLTGMPGRQRINGQEFSETQLATEIKRQIGDHPPRWLVLQGSTTSGVARELARQYAADGRNTEVIGTTGTLAAETLQTGKFPWNGPKWVAYGPAGQRRQGSGLTALRKWLRENSYKAPSAPPRPARRPARAANASGSPIGSRPDEAQRTRPANPGRHIRWAREQPTGSESVRAVRPVPFGGQPTPSGWHFPGSRSEDPQVQAEELAAARFFPPVTGASVLHVHHRTGGFVADGRQLTLREFARQVVDALELPPRQPLIVVACQLASEAVALAALTGRPVVASAEDALTTPDGRIISGTTEFDNSGAPVVRPGNWVVAHPDGSVSPGLGPDLLAILRDGGLAEHLPGVGITTGEQSGAPSRPIRWTAEGETRRLDKGKGRATDDGTPPVRLPGTPPVRPPGAQVRAFGDDRDGSQALSNVGRIPDDTIAHVRDQLISVVEGTKGPDQEFRDGVRAWLTPDLLFNEWARVRSVSGLPVKVKYKGKLYPASVRMRPRFAGAGDPGMEEMPDGAPVQ
ncbi:MAG TPA: hypothetical protein VHF26_18015, partial [Trebonia sp.]|nr:hypothetical protein [Trebonia sp.]